MTRIWLIAIALTLLASAWLYTRPVEGVPNAALGSYDIAFIGSSLTRHAIPAKSPPSGIFGDGRSHIRLARPGLRAWQSNEYLRVALEAGAKQIFIEVYPYLKESYADQKFGRWSGILHLRLDQRFSDFGMILREPLRRALNFRPRWEWPMIVRRDPRRLDQVYDGKTEGFSEPRIYSVQDAKPHRHLLGLLQEADRQGVGITFVSYPRSQTMVEYYGADFITNMHTTFQIFESRFGVQVWRPAIAWPDAYFVDRSHVNLKGRKRYLATLSPFAKRRQP